MREPRRRLQRGAALVAALGVVVGGGTYALATPVEAPPTGMSAVGPVSSEHGFPVWYKDSGVTDEAGNVVREPIKLEQCLDLNDPMCDPAFLREEMQNPDGEMSFPDNWPMESFYMAADSSIDLPNGGDAGLTLALEATFAQDDPGPAAGDQMVFGRVRIRVDTPSTGTYTVTHPYGKDVFNVTDVEEGINFTEDIGASVQQFGDALKSRINPFLTWDTGLVEGENGNLYLGDPAVEHRVTGSLLGTNFFRIEGPGIGGPNIDVIETDLFTLMGKVSTNNGIEPGPVTYSETPEGTKHLNVFARAGSGDAVEVTGEGIPATTLSANGENFFGRLALSGEVPAAVKVSNLSDVPVAESAPVPVTDQVIVTSATYSTADRALTVTASTSDQLESPALTLAGVTNPDGSAVTLQGGTATVNDLAAPPSAVTVTSAAGGSDTAPVAVTGDSVGTVQPTTAIAVGPSTVVSGQQVTLDGSSSMNAKDHVWAQVPNAGETEVSTPVTLDPNGVTASFTAPTGPATLTFTLTVTGPDGTTVTSSPLVVEVTGSEEQPVANATATLSTAQVGDSVTISGAGSTNASSYSWTQTSGETVLTEEQAASQSFTFTMPATDVPLVFELIVTSPTGAQSAPATVTVAPDGDVVTVESAELRTRKIEWRINGTTSIADNNSVTVYLADGAGNKVVDSSGNPITVGTAAVEAAAAPAEGGTWTLRARGVAAPTADTTQLLVESRKGGSELASFTSRR